MYVNYACLLWCRLISETSLQLLGLTMLAALLHLLFEALAFQSDITFWKVGFLYTTTATITTLLLLLLLLLLLACYNSESTEFSLHFLIFYCVVNTTYYFLLLLLLLLLRLCRRTNPLPGCPHARW